MFMDGGRRILDQETAKPKRVSVTLGRFWAYFEKYWAGLVLCGVFILVSTWASLTIPELTSQAIDCYILPTATGGCTFTELKDGYVNGDESLFVERVAGVGVISLMSLGLLVLSSATVGVAFYSMRWSGQNAIRDIQRDLFQKIHALSLSFYSKNEAGQVMSRVTNDIDTIQQSINFALLQVLTGVVSVTWTIIRMLQVNLPYALLSLAVLPVMLFTTIYFSNQARKAFRRARQEIGSVNSELQEGISGAREVQAFNREEETIAAFERSNDANRMANVRAALFTSALTPVLEALGYVSLAIVVVVGGLAALGQFPLVPAESITLGMVFAFLQYSQRANQPIQQIALLWTNVQSGIAGGERIFNLIDEHIDVANAAQAKTMPKIQGDVSFENVSAEYEKGEPVLKNVSFNVKQGQMVAFVGPTGAGKTTIINLLPRFYDATTGAVKIDGMDVRDVTTDSLRSQIGIVLQDTYLFSTTVMDNIRYGRMEASDEEVIEAAKRVAAHDFITRLPEGYETVLGERGSGLSQGQRQLIAIARVALMNPNLLILDEATSSVDTRTERVIQSAFDSLLQGRTSFVIAHRLSTIRNADQIFMLKAGEIVENGTHKELLEKRGEYYNLYMSQFQATEEDNLAGQTSALT